MHNITEALEAFQETYNKLQTSTNKALNERLGIGLKIQIKELLQLNDQIRPQWITSSIIEDSPRLLEHQKLIEAVCTFPIMYSLNSPLFIRIHYRM